MIDSRASVILFKDMGVDKSYRVVIIVNRQHSVIVRLEMENRCLVLARDEEARQATVIGGVIIKREGILYGEIPTLERFTCGGAVGLNTEEKKGEGEKGKKRHGGREERRIGSMSYVIWDLGFFLFERRRKVEETGKTFWAGWGHEKLLSGSLHLTSTEYVH